MFRVQDSEKYDVRFILSLLKQPDFFDYVMENVKGVKMPRGKEEHIKNYKLCIPAEKGMQSAIANQIEGVEAEIRTLEKEVVAAKEKQDDILATYLW